MVIRNNFILININSFKIITKSFEKAIITMYPVKVKKVPNRSFSIDYYKEDKKDAKQIEKFYKKWGKR